MGRRESPLTEPPDGEPNVVPLGVDPPAVAPAPSSRPGRLHGIAIFGLALSALVGIVAMLAFITIRWPGETGRYAMTVFVFAVVSFLTCTSIAVFSAARDTYPRHAGERDRSDDEH